MGFLKKKFQAERLPAPSIAVHVGFVVFIPPVIITDFPAFDLNMATRARSAKLAAAAENIPEVSNVRSGYVTASSSDSEDEAAPKPASTGVRGARLGNRFWKDDRQRLKWSVIVKRKRTVEVNQKEKAEIKHNKDLSRAIKAERAELREKKRERRRENLKKRAENAKKSEVVQVIKNTTKLKKLKKRMLHHIEKRDTTAFE